MNSLILGPGAIGALTCAQIQTYSHVFVWPHKSDMSLANTLQMHKTNVSLQWQLLEKTNPPEIDLIWVCCKVFHAESSTRQALQRFPKAQVILLHNGMGPQQALTEQYGAQIVWGSTTCGALKVNQNSYRQTSFGETQLGFTPVSTSTDALNVLFSQAIHQPPLQLTPTDHIDTVLWQKLVINACINPVTAVHQIQNGQLLDPQYQIELRALAQEIEQLLLQVGVRLNQPVMELVNHVAQLSRTNWSSMAVDVQNRAQTEIDFINGFLIKQGKLAKVPTPLLEMWSKGVASASRS